MTYLTLNNGVVIPQLGTGTNTFGKENHNYMGKITGDTSELLSAIKLGYRLIDTAVAYRNESVIGDAVKQSGIPREDFFLVSKLPELKEYNGTDELVRQTIESSLKNLQTDYMDLYLIHWPWDDLDDIVRVWKVLEKAVDQNKIKAIGVSNFNQEQLKYVYDHARIKPAVNQFLSYPGHEQKELIEFCQELGVVPEAYQSLTKLDDVAKEVFANIGSRYNKDWNQIVLNYQVNKGMIVIPKSHSEVHQQSNFEIFDFELSDDDRAEIESL